MRQILFEFPGVGLKIFGFGAMMVVAFLSATQLAAWRAKREGLDPERIYDLAFWMVIGGVIGARLFFVIQHHESIHTFWDVFKIWQGGIVLYGSLIGAAAGFWLGWLRMRFPILPTLDAIAPSVTLGIAFGRIGCFLNGCCYGDVCDLPWAVQFPPRTAPWGHHLDLGWIAATARWSLPVHPTQLYSALDGLILLALLSAFYPLRRRDGAVMALLLTTYPITRFLIEQLRDDEGAFFAGLTISQNFSILVWLAGLGFWYALSCLPRRRWADTAHAVPRPAD